MDPAILFPVASPSGPGTGEQDTIDSDAGGAPGVYASLATGTTGFVGPLFSDTNGVYYIAENSSGSLAFFWNGLEIYDFPPGAAGPAIGAAGGTIFFEYSLQFLPHDNITSYLFAYTAGGPVLPVSTYPVFSMPSLDTNVPPGLPSQLVGLQGTHVVVGVDPATLVSTVLFTGTGTDNNVSEPIYANGGYYFASSSFVLVKNTYELVTNYYVTDGTSPAALIAAPPAGVTLVALVGAASYVPSGGAALFIGQTAAGEYELLGYFSSGSAAWSVATFPAFAGSPNQFKTVQNGQATFTFTYGGSSTSLYASQDYWYPPIEISKDVILYPGVATGTSGSSTGTGFAATDSLLYFVAGTPTIPLAGQPGEYQLWVTDGTNAGTKMVEDFGTSIPLNLTAAGNTVYFYVAPANTDVTPASSNVLVELWSATGMSSNSVSAQLVANNVTVASLMQPVVDEDTAGPVYTEDDWADTTVSGDWTTATDWSLGTAPNGGEDVVLPTGDYAVTIASGENVAVHSLAIGQAVTTGQDYSTLAVSGSLRISGTLSSSDDDALLINAGAIIEATSVNLIYVPPPSDLDGNDAAVLHGGTLTGTSITIDAGVGLAGFGVIDDPNQLVNQGTIISFSDVLDEDPFVIGENGLTISGGVAGGGSIEISYFSAIELGGSVNQIVEFPLDPNNGSAIRTYATLTLDDPESFTGSVSWGSDSPALSGDVIDLAAITGAASATVSSSDDLVVEDAKGDVLYSLQLDPAGDYGGVTFDVTADGEGGTDVFVPDLIKWLDPTTGGDWNAANVWVRDGAYGFNDTRFSPTPFDDVVLPTGDYAVTIASGENVAVHSLAIGQAVTTGQDYSTLAVSGSLRISGTLSSSDDDALLINAGAIIEATSVNLIYVPPPSDLDGNDAAVLHGGTLTGTSITIDAGVGLAGFGVIDDPNQLVNQGTIISFSDVLDEDPFVIGENGLTISGGVAGGGSIEISYFSAIELGGSVNQIVEFPLDPNNGSAIRTYATLTLDDPESFTGSVSWGSDSPALSGDVIDLAAITGAASATVSSSDDLVVEDAKGDVLYSLQLDPAGDYGGVTFDVTADGEGGTDVFVPDLIKWLDPTTGGDWNAANVWVRDGAYGFNDTRFSPTPFDDVVLPTGDYAVTIASGENVAVHSLAIGQAVTTGQDYSTLAVSGSLRISGTLSSSDDDALLINAGAIIEATSVNLIYVPPPSDLDGNDAAVLHGGTLTGTSITIDAGVGLAGFGVIDDPNQLVNQGTIISFSDVLDEDPFVIGENGLTISGGVAGGGSIEISYFSAIELGGSVNQIVEFPLDPNNGSAIRTYATLTLDDPESFTGSVSWGSDSPALSGDVIDLAAITGAASATVSSSDDLVVEDAKGDVLYSLQLDPAGDYGGVTFDVTADGEGGTDVFVPDLIKWLDPTTGGDWNAANVWVRDGAYGFNDTRFSPTPFDDVVLPTGDYAVTIASGENVAVHSLAIGQNAAVDVDGFLDLSALGPNTSGQYNGTVNVQDGGILVVGADLWLSNLNATGPNSSVQLDGATIHTDPATVSAGGVITGNGAVTGDITDNATIIATGGRLELTGAVTGSGTLQAQSNGMLQLDGAVSNTVSVDFSGVGGMLDLKDPTQFMAVIGGWQPNDTIAVYGIAGQPAPTYGSANSDTTVTYSNGITLAFSGTFAANSIAITEDSAPPCYRRGTRILTNHGEVAVENLRIGELMQTASGQTGARIEWIGHRRVDCTRHPKPQQVWPVRVAAGAFGPGRPHTDLFLSPDHAIYINDVLIPIRHLVNGNTIAQVPVDQVTYYHIELPRHDVMFAEGLPAESYLDVGDRSNFSNGGRRIALYPDFVSHLREAVGYAPLVITGPQLEAARRMVDAPRGGRRAQTNVNVISLA